MLEASVPDQLEKILASATFINADRLGRFLRFTVEQALAGKGEFLKEYLVAVEVFDRPPTFDPRKDSVVRVEARRLRSKLQEYYAVEGAGDDLLIELPKGHYVPIFSHRKPALPPVARARRRTMWLIGGIAASWLLLGAVIVYLTAGLRAPRQPKISSIAVLPFENLSDDSENEYFCSGLRDELTTDVSKIAGLRVIARASASQFGKGHNLAALGKQLGADGIIEGSVRRANARVRVTVQLISVAGNSQIWSETYERDIKDVFGIQEEISHAVTSALKARMTGAGKSGAVKRHIPSPEARALYWKGQYYRHQTEPDGVGKSIEYYEQAVARDPNYADAYAALADAYTTAGFHNLRPPTETVPAARAAAQKALELDQTLAEPHATLAWIRFFFDWDWLGAERDYQRALELNPSFAKAHELYALGLMSRGQFDKAIEESKEAQRLDPLAYVAVNGLGVVLYAARRYDEAAAQARQTLEVNPKYAPAHALLAMCHAAQHKSAQAIQEFQTALQTSPERYSFILGPMGHTLAVSGQREEARKLLKELEATATKDDVYYVHRAYIHAGLGEKDRALDCLEKGCDRHEGDVNFMQVVPFLDGLHKDPRFIALLKRVGLADTR